MRNRIVFLFFCFLLLSAKCFPAVIVVTSNADSGPGTLRDALTQAAANGSATQDIIQFNLPDTSAAGRTITVLSSLPGISSNLEIDGSTQPGAKFGVSDAKVKIIQSFNEAVNSIVALFIIDTQTNISIYGLLLNRADQYITSTFSNMQGIFISNSKNIIIGSPGKGNVIKNFDVTINTANSTEVENLTIASNFLSVNEDGLSANKEYAGANGCLFWSVKNFVLGGDTPAEGNVIYGMVELIGADTTNFGGIYDLGSVKMKNNLAGLNYLGQDTLLTNGKSAATELVAEGFSPENQIEVTNNTIFGGIDMTAASFFTIKGNKIGTDITGTKIFSSQSIAILIAYCTGGGLVGGIDTADQNIFAGREPPPSNVSIDDQGVIYNINSPNIEVIGNNFKCNSGVKCIDLSLKYTSTPVIVNRSSSVVSGTAPPNSRVDLYYSVECSYCEPQILFASAIADISGNWSYSGTLQNHAIIAAATLTSSTSEFTRLSFINQPSDVKIQMACGSKKGSITGLNTSVPVKYAWYDANGNIVATTKDLLDVPAGSYYLIISDSYCSTTSPVYEIKDASDEIDTSAEKVNSASCNHEDGSVTSIQADPSFSISWVDQNGNIVANTLDLLSVAAGTYTLTVTTADGSCSQTLNPITLKNTTGPNIDQSKVKITPTNCGQSTGSITNITATGTGALKYIWWDSKQNTVGTTADLSNQPAGTYQLEVTDDTQCGPVYTSYLVIPELNGITMDETKVQTTVASCSLANGSVTGITATGATQYQWTDANNKVAGSNADLTNVAAGTYTLTATNTFGCSKSSQAYAVSQQAPTQYPVYAYTISPSCPGENDGGINVTTDTLVKAYRWINAQGVIMGNGQGLANIPAGVYQLYLTDHNGCESFYKSYTVTQLPPLVTDNNSGVEAEQCGLKNGSASAPTVAGGTPPYTYTWRDAAQNRIGTGNTLSGLSAGSYTVTITDSGCGDTTISYAVPELTENVAPPSASNVQVCSSGSALLMVNNHSSTLTYRLYNTQTSTQPLDEETSGTFKITVSGNRSFYVSAVSGDCESSRTEVEVSVGLSSLNIANTFTPNGDNINDYWQINGIENYPNAHVQVFTRYGQKVFDSKGYAIPFDGTYNKQKLPAGAYYYIINLNTTCNLLSGSLTIIR